MSIRSEAMPYRASLASQLNDVLRKNGMTAQLALEGDKFKLYVQGHDSPMLQYNISEQQARILTDGGTNYANKKAFQTFNSIVSKDFDMPSSYVSARNVNSRVAMGLHGYRERADNYGRMQGLPMAAFPRPHAFGPGFLGFAPRQQDGFHLRRVGGVAMMPTAMVAEHSDGRIRPGELKSGSYGYYWKGERQQAQAQIVDPMKELKVAFPPIPEKQRSTEPAIPYKEAIVSVGFSNEKWQSVLSSHGIIIDDKDKTMTIQSNATKHDITVNLTDEQYKKLTDNNLKTTPVQERLDIINNVISSDFNGKITMDTLNSKERINIPLKPEVEQNLQQLEVQRIQERYNVTPDPLLNQREHFAPTLNPEKGYVDGSNIQMMNERKGWYREGAHGRAVDVGDIWVEKIPSTLAQRETQMRSQAEQYALGISAQNINKIVGKELFNNENVTIEKVAEVVKDLNEDQKKQLDATYSDAFRQKLEELKANQPKPENKKEDQKETFRMSAVINGEVITHEISQKQYDKFMAVDDYQRQRMMSKVFDEVDMKTRPEMRQQFNLGAFLAAGLTALSEATAVGADIAHNVGHIRAHTAPEVYSEVHGTGHIYVKPGVDSPQDMLSRAFEAGLNQGTYGGHGMGR